MAETININTDDSTDQITTVILDNNIYILRVRYSGRKGWKLSFYDYDTYNKDLSDNSGSLLYGEKALMPFQNFLEYTNNADNLPSGYLFLYDQEYYNRDDYKLAERYDFGLGKRFILVYYTKDEYESYLQEA